jgi:hypothetical protein
MTSTTIYGFGTRFAPTQISIFANNLPHILDVNRICILFDGEHCARVLSIEFLVSSSTNLSGCNQTKIVMMAPASDIPRISEYQIFQEYHNISDFDF